MDRIAWKRISKAEYDSVVSGLSRDAGWRSHVVTIGEPPTKYIYKDLDENGKFQPALSLFKVSCDWLGPNGEIDNDIPGKFWEYYRNMDVVET